MGMVALKCPSCGADIQLDDTREFGFCNFCGTKVMQDRIIVEHHGNVKIDQSDFIQKSLANGRRALNKEDWEEVEKYYNLVEQNSPDNIEAVFFSAFGKAMLSMTDSDYYKRQQKFGVLNKSISIISDCYETTTENKEETIRRIDKYINVMLNSTFVYNTTSTAGMSPAEIIVFKNSLGNRVGEIKWCQRLLLETKETYINELKEIEQIHKDTFLNELLSKYTQCNNPENAKINNKTTNPERARKSGKVTAIVLSLIPGYGILTVIVLAIMGLISPKSTPQFSSEELKEMRKQQLKASACSFLISHIIYAIVLIVLTNYL